MLTQCRETTWNIHTTYMQHYNIIFTTLLCLKVVNMIYQGCIIYTFIYLLFRWCSRSWCCAEQSGVSVAVLGVGAGVSCVGAGVSCVGAGGTFVVAGVSGVGPVLLGVGGSGIDTGGIPIFINHIYIASNI